MLRRTFMPVFILIAFAATAWGQRETAELDIIIRDFSAPAKNLEERQAADYNGYYGFQEFDYSKSTNNTSSRPQRQCNPNGATKGMVQEKLIYDKAYCPREDIMGKEGDPDYIRYRYCAKPMPANPPPEKMCYGEYLDTWYTNGTHTKVINEIMTLECNASGLCGIRDTAYFPLDKYPDSLTWGKQNTSGSGTRHNYGFTVAGSGEFQYVAANNDNFAFFGDDDMWVFIDGVLVIDIGGVHQEVRDSIGINDIAEARGGWKDGSMHSINFFYAERQTTSSHLRLTFRLTNLSPPRFGAPRIIKAETTILTGEENQTLIWVNTKLDLESIDAIVNSGNFPIIIKKSDPSKKDSVNGYRLSSIEYKDADGVGYVYAITGSVCEGKNDSKCVLAINGGDSLSFNVKRDDLREAGSTDNRNVTLPNNSNLYVKSTSNIEATKVFWGYNTTQTPPISFVPIPGDKNPVKPEFSENWFTGNPRDGACNGCENGLPNNGTFPKINQIWDPKTGTMVSSSEDPNLTTNKMVHGFGTAGTPIPPQRAGELILTAFPNASGKVRTNGTTMDYAEWLKNEELQKLFGLPPKVSEYGPYGVADPKRQDPDGYGGYAFVKNGFPNESSVGSNGRIAPTRCIVADSVSKDGHPRINCLNFSLLAKQPFQISVILYDQLGNFVTQYRETITEKEFRSVVQGPNWAAEEQSNVERLKKSQTDSCKAPTPETFGQRNVLTTNGLVKVNVNIYPFSKDGRRFGNGVYIAKIDRVDLPYDGCMNNEGTPLYVNEDYKRYHADQKFGWMRTKPSKK